MRFPIIAGLCAAICMILIYAALHDAGWHYESTGGLYALSFLPWLAIVLAVLWANLLVKKRFSQEFTYKASFMVGINAVFITTALFCSGLLLLYYKVDPELLNWFKPVVATEEVQNSDVLKFILWKEFMGCMMIGILSTTVLAFFLRQKPTP